MGHAYWRASDMGFIQDGRYEYIGEGMVIAHCRAGTVDPSYAIRVVSKGANVVQWCEQDGWYRADYDDESCLIIWIKE